MNKIDLTNNEIIKDIVKNHFSLDESSLNYFNSEIDNRTMIPFYKNLFKDSQDLRLSYELPRDKCEILDKGWSLFKEFFPYFVQTYNLNYNNFVDNKVTINKNNLKIRKAMLSFYMDNKVQLVNDFKKFFIGRNPLKINDSSENLKKEVTEILDTYLDKVSRECLPKSNSIKLVITLNFADWFLCSTSESWKSCLNVDSEFHASYWSGLPGLIGDKNRCMIYITDGNKKNYQGIKVDKIIARSWGILSDKNIIGLIKPYPLPNLFNAETVKEITKINCIDLLSSSKYSNYSALENISKFASCTNVELLYFNTEPKKSSFIFQDIVGFSNKTVGKIIYTGRNGFYYYSKKPYREDSFFTLIDELHAGNPIVNYNGGLTQLIKNKKQIKEYEIKCCSICGEVHAAPQDITIDNHGNIETIWLCERCLREKYSFCKECGSIHKKDSKNLIKVKEIFICKNCFDRSYTFCEDCGEIIKKRRESKIIDEHKGIRFVCNTCLENYKIEEYKKCNMCDCTVHIKHVNKVNEELSFCEECFQGLHKKQDSFDF